jgi:phospholipase/lecithinase/hemolysin
MLSAAPFAPMSCSNISRCSTEDAILTITARTPLNAEPDVIGGQTDWFIQDHVSNNGTKHQKLDMDPSEFVVIIFVGTNDVGVHSFVTDDQNPQLSLVDLAGCQLQTIRNLYALGARRFIVNSLIPLQLTRLFSNSSEPTIYFPSPHDGVAWNKRMFNFVHSLNAVIRSGVAALSQEWRGTATVDVFDTYHLFQQMFFFSPFYLHIAKYSNQVQ